MNKKYSTILAALILTLGFMVSGIASAADAQRPTVTAVTDTSFPPLEFLNTKTGKYEGFDVDILHAVAKRAGFDYELKTMDFAGMIPALQAKSIDLAIAGIFITDARKKAIDFSDPYASSGMKILIRSNDDSIKELSDLAGKTVSTKIGSTDLKYLNKNVPEAKVIPYPSTNAMYMALSSGNADAVFYDLPNMAYYVSHKGRDSVRMVGPLYNPVKVGMAFPKGSKWVEPVNKALAEIKSDGTYAKIYKKWFHTEPPAD